MDPVLISNVEYVTLMTDLTSQTDRIIEVMTWGLILGGLIFGALVVSVILKGLLSNG